MLFRSPALKPSPAGVQQACQHFSARVSVLVGDATIDGLAANRAGVPFIAFRPKEEEMDRRGVVRWGTIHSLTEILPMLPDLHRL